jgi:hypothetical protein
MDNNSDEVTQVKLLQVEHAKVVTYNATIEWYKPVFFTVPDCVALFA